MNEVFAIDKEFLFKNNIHEVTSISIEHNYDIIGSNCEGEFILSGDYRLHEVSINKEDFSFKIPFNTELRSNINLDSVEVEITDFSYELDGDLLRVHIEYLVNGEQSLIEFADESDLEEFLNNNEAEIVDLSTDDNINRTEEPENITSHEETAEEVLQQEDNEEIIEDQEIIIETRTEEMSKNVPEAMPVEETETEIQREPQIEIESDEVIHEEISKDTIINSINAEEAFVTYHVHTVTAADTLEGICSTYNINIQDLKKMNNIEELMVNTKLIIPDEEN